RQIQRRLLEAEEQNEKPHKRMWSQLETASDQFLTLSFNLEKLISPYNTLTGHKGHVRSVAFSPDGKMLASGSDDETIKLWELPSGRELLTLAGHKDYIRSVAFSPNGKILARNSNAK